MYRVKRNLNCVTFFIKMPNGNIVEYPQSCKFHVIRLMRKGGYCLVYQGTIPTVIKENNRIRTSNRDYYIAISNK